MENNNNPSSSSSSRTDRKIIERNRRNQMKALYSRLNSLVPQQSLRDGPISLPDQLDEATKYIKKLQMNLEKLKDRKNMLLEIQRPYVSMNRGETTTAGSKSPQIEIQQMGLAVVVVLTTGLDCGSLFNETIRVLHEEGADIVGASYMAVEDSIFHTIHCQVVESSNNGAARISERLKFIMYDSGN